MANRVSFGLSMGNMPRQDILTSGSLKRSATTFRPMLSVISWKRILIKIRELDVVSSSVSWMQSNTFHDTASDARRCPKKRAMFRRRLVSYRWMVS